MALVLPCIAREADIVAAVMQNPITILTAETGSGKSTQIPLMVANAQFQRDGYAYIAVTQPRRLAATSLAKRVASEQGGEVGGRVGFAVRGERKISAKTCVLYCTDGWLEQRGSGDPNFFEFSAIILDEFHVRSLSLELLFGLVTLALDRRSDLRLVLLSATLPMDLIRKAMTGRSCSFLEVSGRSYPVKEHNLPTDDTAYLLEVCKQVLLVLTLPLKTHVNDILVFLPGKSQITKTHHRLHQKAPPGTVIVGIHGGMPIATQEELAATTAPPGSRVVILATDVAEASLTLSRVRYVVDSGRCKKSRWCFDRKLYVMQTLGISDFAKKQRKGRAGRTAPGFSLHLGCAVQTVWAAEIHTSDLSPLNLKLRCLGHDPVTFFWLESPTPDAIAAADRLLQDIGALDQQLAVTDIGRQLRKMPVSPLMGRLCLACASSGIGKEGAAVVALAEGQAMDADMKDSVWSNSRGFKD